MILCLAFISYVGPSQNSITWTWCCKIGLALHPFPRLPKTCLGFKGDRGGQGQGQDLRVDIENMLILLMSMITVFMMMYSWHRSVFCWHLVEFSVTSEHDDGDDGDKEHQPQHNTDHHPGGLGVGLAGNSLNAPYCKSN